MASTNEYFSPVALAVDGAGSARWTDHALSQKNAVQTVDATGTGH